MAGLGDLLSLFHFFTSRTSAYNGKIDAWKSQHTINIQWRKFTHSNRHRLLWLWVDLRFWLVKLFEFPPFVPCRHHELEPQVAATRIEVLTLFLSHSDLHCAVYMKIIQHWLFAVMMSSWETLEKKKNNFIIKAILWNFSMEHLSSLASWWTFKLLQFIPLPPAHIQPHSQLPTVSSFGGFSTRDVPRAYGWRMEKEERKKCIKYIKYQSENHMKFIIFILQKFFHFSFSSRVYSLAIEALFSPLLAAVRISPSTVSHSLSL